MDTLTVRCPECGSYVSRTDQTECATCRLPLDGAESDEIQAVLAELGRLTARRTELLYRRDTLLGVLRARRAAAIRQWPAPAPAIPRAGTTAAPSMQTVLLTVGGLLITISGLVFTLVNWGRLGIGGRGAVLGAVTALVLTVPFPLRRRRLDATAETAAAVGVVLVLLDCYAARAAGLAGLRHADTAGYWAAVTALAALGTAGYARPTRSKLLPFAALLLLQCAAPLAAASLDLHGAGLASALLSAAAVDLAVGARPAFGLGGPLSTVAAAVSAPGTRGESAAGMPGDSGETTVQGGPAATPAAPGAPGGPFDNGIGVTRGARFGASVTDGSAAARGAWVGAAAWAAAAEVVATAAGVHATTYGSALRACVPLLLLAALGAAVAHWPKLPYADRLSYGRRPSHEALRSHRSRSLHGPRSSHGPRSLHGPCSSRGRQLPFAHRLYAGFLAGFALAAAAAAVLHCALADTWMPLAATVPGALLLAASLPRLRHPFWGGLTAAGSLVLAGGALQVLPLLARALGEPLRGFPSGWRVDGVVPAVAVLVAAALWSAARVLRPQAVVLRCGAVLAGVAALALVPVAAGWPYGVAVAVAGTPALVAAALMVWWPEGDPDTQLCCLVASLGLALVWSLPQDTAALVVWGASATLVAALTATGRITYGGAAFTVVALGVEGVRAGLAAGLPPHLAAFLVLAVAVATVPVAARLRDVEVEWAGYAVGGAALAMTSAAPDALSVALAVAGTAALGLALRTDRRTAGSVAGAALLIASSWVRLALAGVGAPEPYTVGASAAVLLLGHLRLRRVPSTGSWQAYGAGLGFTLLPSLAAAWTDPHWQRPLLLGLAALTVTLLGAHHHLRAPLLLGGAVLVADALHELAPGVVQSLGLLPRWAPLTAAGLLLVFLGTTYERRLTDSRRLRDGLRRMR